MATELTEDKRQQLDNIVQKMMDNQEPEDNIRTVVDDFKNKYTQKSPTISPPPPSTPWSQRLQNFFEWPGAKEAGRQFIKGMSLPLGMAGATAGSAFGPLGTALGYAGGERVGRALETATGVSPPETPAEAAGKTALDTGLGFIPEVPGVVKQGAQTVKSLLKKPAVRMGEVFEAVGGKAEPLVAGESAVQSAKQKFFSLNRTGDALYKTAERVTPEDATLTLDNLYATTDKILKDESITNPGVKKLATEIRDRVAQTMSRRYGTPEQLLGTMERAEETGQLGAFLRPNTFKEAYGTRTILSNASRKEGPVKHYAGEMLDALHQDLGEGATKLDVPEVNTAYKKAIDFWRDKVVPQREMVKAVEVKSPENLVNFVMKDVKTARQIKQGLPEADLQSLKQGILTRISDVAKNDRQTVENIQKLFRTKKEVMKELFSEEEFGAIQAATDPGKFAKYLEEHPRVRWLVKWIPVGMAIEAGRQALGGRIPLTIHHGMESRQMGGPVYPAFQENTGQSPLPFLGSRTILAMKGTRGMLGKSGAEKEGTAGQSGLNKEIGMAQSAISRGAPLDKVKQMFKQRTGEEWPIK